MHFNISTLKTRTLLVALAASVAAIGITACGSSSDGGTGSKAGGSIDGAGATFPAPVYSEWASKLKSEQGTTVNYLAIGSGGGIAQFTTGTVDFGATDAAMKDDEVAAAKKKGTPVHIPSVFGAVTVSYNVGGVKGGLKLDGPTIANIYLGKITKWNDSAIAGQNSGVNLPATDIRVCHRSDGSGTTKLFTTFLAAYSPEWKNGPGTDKTVQWPTGTGAKGNDGVAACVKQTDGAIGYVEQAYALQNNFTFASVKNSAGNYIAPTLASTAAAGAAVKAPADLRFDAINAPGADSYPIASATFLLVYQDMCKAGISSSKAKLVVNWLNYALGDGQAVAKQLQYSPLPAGIRSAAKKKVDGLVCNGKAIG